MISGKVGIVLVLASACLTATAPISAQVRRQATAKEIAAVATPASVTILTLSESGDTLAQGSGFFVTASGVLITNWHVLRGAARAIVVRTSGPRYERVSFIGGDSVLDLAVLKVAGYGLPYLRMRESSPPVGEAVIVIGSPLGFTATVSTGIVSGLRTERGRDAVQISAPISPGSSGGAVLDASGRVFAVASWRARGGEVLNFAVPVRYAMSWVNGTLTERPLASVFNATEPSPRRQDAAARASASSPPAPRPPRTAGPAAPVLKPLPVPKRAPASSLPVSGTYLLDVEVHWDSLNLRARREGLLVLDERFDGFGLVVQSKLRFAPGDTTLLPLEISEVQSFRRMPDGRIVLDDWVTPMSGFPTADGFFLTGSGRDEDDDHYIQRMHATESSVELTKNLGVFEATWETTWYSDSGRTASPERMLWTGGVAVATTSDSIFVSLALGNSRGGSTGFEGRDVLKTDGSFAITTRNGSWLRGTVRAGLLIAEFRDRREKSYFTGSLHGTRK